MKTKTSIAEAITRSVSHIEIVRVVVPDIESAIKQAEDIACECDHTAENPGEDSERREDVWGLDQYGNEFRLLLIQDQSALVA